MTTIVIPSSINDRNLLNFFVGWLWNTNPTPPVILDFNSVDYIAPYGITLFAAYILWLKKVKGMEVSIITNQSSSAGNYLAQAGFYELLELPEFRLTNHRPERTVKLAKITSSKEIPAFTTSVMEILKIEDEEMAGALKYSLIELLRNVVQHSSSEIGGVAMAQYFPSTGLVEICVVDMGLGIKNTLNEAYPEIDSNLKALKFATQPHVSRTFGPSSYTAMKDNAGLGLFFIKQIASLSGGSFFLGSNDALVDIWGDKKGVQKKVIRNAYKGGWPGTFAYLQLRRDSIGEFDSLLETCREIAAEAKKYPAELALDFIEDIPEVEDLTIVRVFEFEEDVEKAAEIRDAIILPTINSGKMLVIDFSNVKFATQSFVHALMYKVIRDGQQIGATLSLANCTNSTRQAVMAVAAYAKIYPKDS